MYVLATRLGVSGSVLGILAGFVELSVGAQIRPWIGNKESPEALGLLTLILSSIALAAVLSAHRHETPTDNGKLAVLFGILLPAAICFTTVGRLWYLPGALLIAAAVLLVREYWVARSMAHSPTTPSGAERASTVFGLAGSLAMSAVFGLAFWRSQFGLFRSDLLVNTQRVRFEVLPMDFVRQTSLVKSATLVADTEVGMVRIVYALLILGAAVALIAVLTKSRLFMEVGAGAALAGLALFIVGLPGILEQAGYPSESIPALIGSLGWGWYLAAVGVGLTVLGSRLRIPVAQTRWPRSARARAGA